VLGHSIYVYIILCLILTYYVTSVAVQLLCVYMFNTILLFHSQLLLDCRYHRLQVLAPRSSLRSYLSQAREPSRKEIVPLFTSDYRMN